MHSIKGGMTNCQAEMKRAVDCGYWNLFRYDPAAEKPFTLDSKEPAGGYREFLMNEARYSRLTREFPDRAERLFEASEENAKARYELDLERSHITKIVTAVMPDRQQRSQLKIGTEPLLKVAHPTYLKDGRPFEYTETYYVAAASPSLPLLVCTFPLFVTYH